MRSLRARVLRLVGLFVNERRERDLAEEMKAHLHMHVEDNLRAGMSPAEARREARVKLGGLEQTKQNYRAAPQNFRVDGWEDLARRNCAEARGRVSQAIRSWRKHSRTPAWFRKNIAGSDQMYRPSSASAAPQKWSSMLGECHEFKTPSDTNGPL